jgi:hypothetical protein
MVRVHKIIFLPEKLLRTNHIRIRDHYWVSLRIAIYLGLKCRFLTSVLSQLFKVKLLVSDFGDIYRRIESMILITKNLWVST